MKTFGELEIGDVIYFVEVTTFKINFTGREIIDIGRAEDSDTVCLVFKDKGPTEFPGNESSMYGLIFTDEEEAKDACRAKIANNIKYLEGMLDYFKNYEL